MIILHFACLLGIIAGVAEAVDGNPRVLLKLSLPCAAAWIITGLLFGWPVPE